MNPEVSDIIETIEVSLRAGADVDEITPLVHKLVSAVPMSLGSTHNPGVELYRATKHHRAVPTSIEELWFPPVEKALLARANRRGQPIFYCSSDPACALNEIGATADDLVVHAKWVTETPMLLHDLGYTEQVLSRAGSRRALPEHHQSFYQSLDQTGKTTRDYIALCFTKPTSEKYALTAAIAEVHLRADEFAGLLYPAVSRAANVDNLALRPEFVRGSLLLERAQLLKLDETPRAGADCGEILADMSNVGPDGALSWTFREAGSSLPPGGARAARPGERLLCQSSGEIEVEGERYRIAAGYMIEVTAIGVIVRDLRGEVVQPLAGA